MQSIAEHTTVDRAHGHRARLSWARSCLFAVAAVWLPFAVAAVCSHRVRRVLYDFWLWPGLFPGSMLADTLYSEWFGLITLCYVILWTAVIRYKPVLGVLGALICSFVSMGRLMALLAI